MLPNGEAWVLGFDVGGTKTECVLARYTTSPQEGGLACGPLGEGTLAPRLRRRVATGRGEGYGAIVSNMVSLGKSLLEDSGLHPRQIVGVGFGLPGAIDPTTQMMTNGNTLVLRDKPLATQVAQGLGTPPLHVAVANDANCFALAESVCGQGLRFQLEQGVAVGDQTVLGLILGTGCGGGLVHRGRIVEGARGAALELGHMSLVPLGHPCYCGQWGCAEQYVSGTAIESAFSSRRTSAHTDGPYTGAQIFHLADQGDPVAQAVVAQTQRHLAQLLAQLTNLFDPHYFVLGGGLSLQGALLEGLDKLIEPLCFVQKKIPPVYPNTLGDSAGVLGAALLGLKFVSF